MVFSSNLPLHLLESAMAFAYVLCLIRNKVPCTSILRVSSVPPIRRSSSEVAIMTLVRFIQKSPAVSYQALAEAEEHGDFLYSWRSCSLCVSQLC